MASTSKQVFINDDTLADLINNVSTDDDYVSSEDELETQTTNGEYNCAFSESESDENDIVPTRRQPPVTNVSDSDNDEIEANNLHDSGDDELNDNNDINNIQIPVFREIESGQDIPFQPAPTYLETPGPKHAPPSDANPIQYFLLFFTMPLLNLIVTETNRYANQFLASQNQLSPHARAKMWRPVTVPEMKAFMAVLFEMGITRRPTIFSYWAKNSRAIPWFGSLFSTNRFQLNLKFYHLVDNTTLFPPGHEQYDPCARFSPLVDHANRLFRFHYTPHSISA